MRYLVTGGAGFIGSHLVDALVSRDLGEVVVFDNLHRGRREFIAEHLASGRVRFVEGDIRHAESLLPEFDGVDVVFHLAAQSNVIGAGQDVRFSSETNVLGTVNVLDAALRQGVGRVVFTSSREVYGDTERLPVPETAPFAAKNLYGASKVAGEMYCRAYQGRGLDVRVVRLGNAYGARDRDRVIPIWLERAAKGLNLELYGGKQILDLVPVAFIVEALIRTSEAPEWPGPINIASGKGTRLTDLAARVLELTGSPSRMTFLPARTEEVVGFVADVSAMQQHLGLQPPEPLRHLPNMVALTVAPYVNAV
ncbi:MAG TPA: SDR family NAD(P)-dependent oxidoreductase [Dehalococcoidia bacterium]|nr:SDR family NAD(P)-dependent oxidoreductase [Dehalococcoidia bacterium]